jgi:CheY-like chemotaxis protein
MPVMSGYEATRALRAMGRRPPPAHHRADRRRAGQRARQALAAGMDDFLTKPIDGS